ncbi:ABC transporter substrate-binding protein [Pseudothauera rhizosphaerae]|uniref:Putative aliphatic sulfonates-binding protein n=1 Tax=Pseudothauera rhizosphaerae TaxID=2565932 RepID=A0A4S4B0L0_9RHOO|nr:ABC transporter substrate-binding protein [Pseudothauera rhizosphaerae]THF65174.1 nitrate ABC transporter substrate-binding protein [Pseudothauera rhizosphaerae]
MKIRLLLAGATLSLTALSASAETIRVAIGTQDTTINCATAGLLVRELGLLEKYLPRDGKYKDAQYDIQWKNFTSGPPLTNEMVADKLDLGVMAEFPGTLNVTAFQKAGKRSYFIAPISGSVIGSGNGVVVPADSPVQSFAELKGKTISVPFGSTAHGVLLRAIDAQGWDPARDVNLISQSPEVGGSALQSGKVDAHANFVPFPDLFPFRGFARKIFDGSQTNAPTFHGALASAAYAEKYPEVVVAYLRAVLEAERLFVAEPEKYSELIAKVTGIDAEVNYLFHGPVGLQTRDYTWKPEFYTAIGTAIKTLRLLDRPVTDLKPQELVNERYIREAYRLSGLDYDARLKVYDKLPLRAKDASSGAPITDFRNAAHLWLKGEATAQHYASPQAAFAALKKAEAAGKEARVVFVHDRNTGLKLFANQAWYVRDGQGGIAAFLLKADADAWAQAHGGQVNGYADARNAALAVASK